MHRHLFHTDIRADETSEFIGRNLTKSLESCDLRIGSQLTDGRLALFLTITVTGDEVALLARLGVGIGNHLLVANLRTTIAHSEERCLQHIDMTLLDEFWEELQEERDEQQTDMHAVDISIGGHNHLVISQVVQSFLDVERCLQKIEFLVLIDHLLCQLESIQGFASQREHGLSVHIATLRDAAAGGVSLSNKDARLFLAVVLRVTVMDTTVAQLTVMEVGLLGSLTGQFGHAGNRLTVALALLDLILQHLGHIAVDMQIVVYALFDEVAHIFINTDTLRRHGGRAQLDLRLTLKDGFLDIDGDGGYDTRSDITILIFIIELLDGSGDVLLEGALMGAALNGMLTIDERVILLAILVGMGKGYLDVLALQVDDGIEGIAGHAVLQQVFETVS